MFVDTCEEQWETVVAGQVVDTVARLGSSGTYLLPDGAHVGYHRRIYAIQTLPIPGTFFFFFLNVDIDSISKIEKALKLVNVPL